jgi:predicted MPP superfamily phosphohydrolase
MNKRQFLQKSFYGLAGFGLLSGLYSWKIEPFWVEFVKQKMPIKNLPKHLIGKTLMQISDIHIGKGKTVQTRFCSLHWRLYHHTQ